MKVKMKQTRANPGLKKQLRSLYLILEHVYGPQKCFLTHDNPFQLLVATILSAQCTDKRVNSVTPALFQRYPDARSLAAADQTELESMIHECGFYRAKSKNLIACAARIVQVFQGQIPRCMEDLISLPGVGRKTANVVLGDSLGIPGLPVDTHVKRLSRLIGLLKSDDPDVIEAVLCKNLDPADWAEFSHLLIIHGRTRCPARRPDCKLCEIQSLCNFGRKKGTSIV